jgi:hypothetical protein
LALFCLSEEPPVHLITLFPQRNSRESRPSQIGFVLHSFSPARPRRAPNYDSPPRARHCEEPGDEAISTTILDIVPWSNRPAGETCSPRPADRLRSPLACSSETLRISDLLFAIHCSQFHSCINILHASCLAVKWNSGEITSFYRVESEYAKALGDKGLHSHGDSRRVGCAHRPLVIRIRINSCALLVISTGGRRP